MVGACMRVCVLRACVLRMCAPPGYITGPHPSPKPQQQPAHASLHVNSLAWFSRMVQTASHTPTTRHVVCAPHTHTHHFLHCCPLPQSQGEKEKEITDCKLIVQNIVYGTKTLLFSILYCTRHYNHSQQYEAAKVAAMAAGQPLPPPYNASMPPAVPMVEDDVLTCSQLLQSGLACIKVATYFG